MKHYFIQKAIIILAVAGIIAALSSCGTDGGKKSEITALTGSIEIHQLLGEDILNFKADGAHCTSDGWTYVDGKFFGPLEEPHKGEEGATKNGSRMYARRYVQGGVMLPDGSKGNVLRIDVDADRGYRVGCNFYGIGYAKPEPETLYCLTARFHYEDPNCTDKKAALGYSDDFSGGLLYYKYLEPSEEWQTESVLILTGSGPEQPLVSLGPSYVTGIMNAGFIMETDSITLRKLAAEDYAEFTLPEGYCGRLSLDIKSENDEENSPFSNDVLGHMTFRISLDVSTTLTGDGYMCAALQDEDGSHEISKVLKINGETTEKDVIFSFPAETNGKKLVFFACDETGNAEGSYEFKITGMKMIPL